MSKIKNIFCLIVIITVAPISSCSGVFDLSPKKITLATNTLFFDVSIVNRTGHVLSNSVLLYRSYADDLWKTSYDMNFVSNAPTRYIFPMGLSNGDSNRLPIFSVTYSYENNTNGSISYSRKAPTKVLPFFRFESDYLSFTFINNWMFTICEKHETDNSFPDISIGTNRYTLTLFEWDVTSTDLYFGTNKYATNKYVEIFNEIFSIFN